MPGLGDSAVECIQQTFAIQCTSRGVFPSIASVHIARILDIDPNFEFVSQKITQSCQLLDSSSLFCFPFVVLSALSTFSPLDCIQPSNAPVEIGNTLII